MVDSSLWETSPDTCLLQRNRTNIILSVYEGIPETLLLNVIGWVALLLLFTLLRKRAWDYGRLALVQSSERWTRLFYRATDQTVASVRPPDLDSASMDSLLKIDQGCCSWITATLHIDEEKIRTKCGPDALHYLSFQKHLLLLTSIFMVVALAIVLPVNFQGSLQGDETTFGHTTVSNLDPNSPLLWLHIGLAFAFMPLGMYVMSRSSGRVASVDVSSRTLMVTNIAQAHRNQSDIFHYLRLLFKDVTFKNVELAYDVSKLTVLVEAQQRVCNARLQAEAHFKRTGERLRVQPKGCIACCGWGTEDALDYYTHEEARLLHQVDHERSRALARPLGIAFVTVSSHEAAEFIVNQFQPGTFRNWVFFHAPAPSDIFWENLSVKTRFWYLKAILINLTLFLVLFFLTTPAIIVNMIDSFYITKDEPIEKVSPLVSEFLPTLLLCTMAALMPVVVSYSDEWLSYWTRSKQNHAIMQKTYFFLLFMILILPSLGLTSAQAFIEWSLEPHNQTYKWECVFLPDKGAFFVNYVITSGLIGTALELIRFPELFMYVWSMCMAKSSAETLSIRKAILLEFPFGVHYAWTLAVFTMVTVYSLICPLITPFGLMYLALKHFVDRYNLYFAYGPTNMTSIGGGQIHASAVYMIRVAMVLLLAIMAGLTVLRSSTMDTMAIVAVLGLVCACGCLFLCVRQCSPVATLSLDEADAPEPDPDYVAPVLQPSHLFEPDGGVMAAHDYGSSQVDDLTSGLVTNITL